MLSGICDVSLGIEESARLLADSGGSSRSRFSVAQSIACDSVPSGQQTCHLAFHLTVDKGLVRRAGCRTFDASSLSLGDTR